MESNPELVNNGHMTGVVANEGSANMHPKGRSDTHASAITMATLVSVASGRSLNVPDNAHMSMAVQISDQSGGGYFAESDLNISPSHASLAGMWNGPDDDPDGQNSKQRRRSVGVLEAPLDNKRAMARASMIQRPKHTVAVDFDIRANVDEALMSRILRQNGKMRDEESERWLQKFLTTGNCRILIQACAFVSLVCAPLLLAAEAACGFSRERAAMFALKMLELLGTLTYLLIQGLRVSLVQRPEGNLWWKIDLLVVVSLIGQIVHLPREPVGVPAPEQWLCLLSVAKQFRVDNSDNKVRSTATGFWLLIIHLFLKLVFFAHFATCIFNTLALYEYDVGEPTYAESFMMDARPVLSCRELYMFSMYFTTYTITSIGYGDVVPQNFQERGLDVLLMMISQLYMAQLFADLNFINSVVSHWWALHYTRMISIHTALDSIKAPAILRERVIAYQEFEYAVLKDSCARDAFQNVPKQLQQELDIVLNYRLVLKAPFLQGLSMKALRHIISSLQNEVYLPTDFIIKRLDSGSDLYFLREGLAHAFVSTHAPSWGDLPVRIIKAGEFFGEVAMLTGQPRSGWVYAGEYCVCSILSTSTLDHVFADDPSCVPILVNSMKGMLGLDERQLTSFGHVARCMEAEFEDELEAFEFACSGVDGEERAGIITWKRYLVLMKRLGIKDVDQKLLWASLPIHENACVDFQDFIQTLNVKWGDEEEGGGEAMNVIPELGPNVCREMSMASTRSCPTPKSPTVGRRRSRWREDGSRKPTLKHRAYSTSSLVSGDNNSTPRGSDSNVGTPIGSGGETDGHNKGFSLIIASSKHMQETAAQKAVAAASVAVGGVVAGVAGVAGAMRRPATTAFEEVPSLIEHAPKRGATDNLERMDSMERTLENPQVMPYADSVYQALMDSAINDTQTTTDRPLARQVSGAAAAAAAVRRKSHDRRGAAEGGGSGQMEAALASVQADVSQLTEQMSKLVAVLLPRASGASASAEMSLPGSAPVSALQTLRSNVDRSESEAATADPRPQSPPSPPSPLLKKPQEDPGEGLDLDASHDTTMVLASAVLSSSDTKDDALEVLSSSDANGAEAGP
eukprot:TRINITY_DN28449_c0_g2_i1.p1 TRINITY_DN28449_c0_g2~~TRINITY_DN28449_c0_g2_i1.p1  ORF type:complete len:1083 (-),score=218.67 TRINITY_DN28449_c0_g2_i1:207-3455(-)